jgi:hypothetical protein
MCDIQNSKGLYLQSGGSNAGVDRYGIVLTWPRVDPDRRSSIGQPWWTASGV